MKHGEDAREPEPPLFGSSFTDVSADFTLGRRLGTGNFAKVVLGHLKRPMPHWKLAAGDGAAIKVIKKEILSPDVEAQIINEAVRHAGGLCVGL